MAGELGKMLVIAGALMVLVGIILWRFPGFPFPGRLPGDIVWRKGNFTFYFPLVTCVILSFALTLLVWLLSRK